MDLGRNRSKKCNIFHFISKSLNIQKVLIFRKPSVWPDDLLSHEIRILIDYTNTINSVALNWFCLLIYRASMLFRTYFWTYSLEQLRNVPTFPFNVFNQITSTNNYEAIVHTPTPDLYLMLNTSNKKGRLLFELNYKLCLEFRTWFWKVV